jgi:hypothetical protein
VSNYIMFLNKNPAAEFGISHCSQTNSTHVNMQVDVRDAPAGQWEARIVVSVAERQNLHGITCQRCVIKYVLCP